MTDNKKDDFTSLDLMPEFIHEENAEVDNLFKEAANASNEPKLDETLEAPDEEVSLETPAELPAEESSFSSEAPLETVEESGELNFNSETPLPTESEGEVSTDNTFGSENFNFDAPAETVEALPEESTAELLSEPEEKKASPPPPIMDEVVEPKRAPPETLTEVRTFAENMSYGKVGVGGNPPFSLILKNIKFEEDAGDILIILKEFGIATSENEAKLKESLANGSIIISQISEYAAIFLTHKLRRFEADILMGLSEEIHPSKGFSVDFKGLTSKETLFQNKKEFIEFNPDEIDLKSIIVTTTQTIEGKAIKYYIGVASEHLILSESELISGTHLTQNFNEETLALTEEKGHLKIHDYLNEIQLKISELNKLS